MKQKLSILLFFFSLMSATGASAQLKKFSIGPYIEAAWPRGDFSQSSSNGIGVGIAGDLKLGRKLNLMGAAGYLRFGGKNTSEGRTESITAIPVRVGIKYKLPLVYLKLESGMARFNNGGSSALIVSPGLGIRILGLDVQGSYESWLADEGRSFTSLKIAYHF